MGQGVNGKMVCIFCRAASNLDVLIPARHLRPDQANVLKCRACGLVFLELLEPEVRIAQQEAGYWNNGHQKEVYLQEKIEDLFKKEFENRLSRLEEFLPERGKLLDVGCGVGHFLATAKTRGWAVRGLDISEGARDSAGETYGLQVEVGTLESARDTVRPGALLEKLDAITLWDVIEHIRRPIENLNAANQLLRMGGILAMKTPNEEGLFKQFSLGCYRLFGDRATFLLKYVYYIPHYFSYTKKTLGLLLERSGFQALDYEIDETPEEFAAEKINVHYQRDPHRSKVIALLPAANFFATLFGRGNKIVVYAKKVREVACE